MRSCLCNNINRYIDIADFCLLYEYFVKVNHVFWVLLLEQIISKDELYR